MDDAIVILKGHYRSFSHTHNSWNKSLKGCKYKMYIHVWNTIDSISSTWHNTNKNVSELTDENIKLLKSYDDACVIEEQTWTEKEKTENRRNNVPFKALLYYWHGIHSCINRIDKPAKYVIISRPDIWVNIDFKNIVCEEGELLMGYSYAVNSRFPYAVTDVIYLFNYSDLDKFRRVPSELYDWKNNANLYRFQEDHVIDFFNKNWKKVTPKWFFYDNYFKIVRIPCKKMAVLLWGKYSSDGQDYRKYKKNIERYIYDSFESSGYEIDTFICTNIQKELFTDYKAVEYIFSENPDKVEVLKLLLEYSSNTGKQYDLVCLSRFDLYFLETIIPDLEKVNTFSKSSDNFFIFPTKILSEFLDATIKNEIEKRFDVNYMKGEAKVNMFDDLPLILTKFIFTDTVKYYSIGKSVEIVNNGLDMYFKKIKDGKHIFSWFGYELRAGSYDLSFDILSNKVIDFPFIKSHSPIIFFKTPYIEANVPVSIKVRIKIEKTYSLLAFIFDDYPECIEIQFKNISYTTVKDI